MFRQDYRINKIILPFQPPARRAYASERRKAKKSIEHGAKGIVVMFYAFAFVFSI